MAIIILAILIRIFSNSMSNVIQKQLTSFGIGAYFINFIMYLGLTLICLPFVNFANLSGLSAVVWVSAILGGLFGALGNSYLVKALQKGDLSVLGPINAYKSVVAMLFAIILLREIPTIYGIFGIILIIWGSYFVFATQKEGFSLALFKRQDIRFRIYALIFTAIEAVFIKNVIVNSDINTAFFMWCVFGCLFTIRKEDLSVLTPRVWKRLILVIVFMGLMQYSTNYVFSKINVSYGLALFQLSTILNVFLGWKYFKEKDILKKLTGSIIMVAGSAVLILFG